MIMSENYVSSIPSVVEYFTFSFWFNFSRILSANDFLSSGLSSTSSGDLEYREVLSHLTVVIGLQFYIVHELNYTTSH